MDSAVVVVVVTPDPSKRSKLCVMTGQARQPCRFVSVLSRLIDVMGCFTVAVATTAARCVHVLLFRRCCTSTLLRRAMPAVVYSAQNSAPLSSPTPYDAMVEEPSFLFPTAYSRHFSCSPWCIRHRTSPMYYQRYRPTPASTSPCFVLSASHIRHTLWRVRRRFRSSMDAYIVR